MKGPIVKTESTKNTASTALERIATAALAALIGRVPPDETIGGSDQEGLLAEIACDFAQALVQHLHTAAGEGDASSAEAVVSHIAAGHGWTLIEPVGDGAAVMELPVIGWLVHTSRVHPDRTTDDGDWFTSVSPITAEGSSLADAVFLLRDPEGTLTRPGDVVLPPEASPLDYLRELLAMRGVQLAPLNG